MAEGDWLLARSSWSKVVTAIVLLLLVVGCSSQEYILIFDQRTNESHTLYAVPTDGSPPQQLITFPRGDLFWLSPDGRRVAVLAGSSTESREFGTLTVTELATREMLGSVENVGQTASEGISTLEFVSWSPQGEALTFLRNSAGGQGTDIGVYDLITGQVTSLTDDEAVERAVTWSPDGELIAFASLKACGPSSWDCPPDEAYWDIVTVQLDGSNRETVVDFRGTEIRPDNNYDDLWRRSLCGLFWSPNSTFVVFEDDCSYFYPPTRKEVYVAATDGAHVRRLTQLTDPLPADDPLYESVFAYSVQWSPDGDRLFIGYSKEPFGPPNPESTVYREGLLVIESGVFTATEIAVPDGFSGETVRWSPDARYLAWEQQTGPGTIEAVSIGVFVDNQIVVLDISPPLPEGTCALSPFQWSPDGQYLAYAAFVRGEDANCLPDADSDIMIVSLPDGAVVDVTAFLKGNNLPLGWVLASGRP